MLGEDTIAGRERLVRRFVEFAESYPWGWGPGDVEDFTVSLTTGKDRLSISTIRSYHLTLRLFCDYLTDARYEWAKVCRDRFAQVPTQVCHEWNTVAHLNEYEGQPQRRPLTYGEVQLLFDYLDDRVESIASAGKKGSLGALRDALMLKSAYAFGLRRNELCRLDVADLRPNPHVPAWGPYGSVHVRFGKALRGGLPRRRTVVTVPEFDWIVERAGPMDRRRPPALRGGGPPRLVGDRAAHPCGAAPHRPALRADPSRDRARREPEPALPAPLLRDASDRVRLPRALRPGPGRARLRVDHRHLHLGQRRLQEPDPQERARGASIGRTRSSHENGHHAVEPAPGDGRPGHLPDQRARSPPCRARHPPLAANTSTAW